MATITPMNTDDYESKRIKARASTATVGSLLLLLLGSIRGSPPDMISPRS
jgi:hypothetical protein